MQRVSDCIFLEMSDSLALWDVTRPRAGQKFRMVL